MGLRIDKWTIRTTEKPQTDHIMQNLDLGKKWPLKVLQKSKYIAGTPFSTIEKNQLQTDKTAKYEKQSFFIFQIQIEESFYVLLVQSYFYANTHAHTQTVFNIILVY